MATASTAKLTPDDGNPIASPERRRLSDRQLAQATAMTRIAESSAPADPAFERRYRIGELAKMWQLGGRPFGAW
jgi:hypothetical protein